MHGGADPTVADLLLEWEECCIYRGKVRESEEAEQARMLQELGIQLPGRPTVERDQYGAKVTGDPVIDLLEGQLARGEMPDMSLL